MMGHVPYVEPEPAPDGRLQKVTEDWVARCSCGWREGAVTKNLAQKKALEHEKGYSPAFVPLERRGRRRRAG